MHGHDDSTPIASGKIAQVDAVQPVEPASDKSSRSKRLTGLIQDTVSGGVEKLGSGIDTIGKGVSKLGELTGKVPLVGAGVSLIGEGLEKAGGSIEALPRVAQTRRGRLLVRSVIVGFLLVFAWIALIVGWELRANDTPDFRPEAEHILVELSQGSAAIAQVYEAASPRFQENVREEVFLGDMTDMNATLGKFRELTAINDTLVTHGPTGKIGRVSLTAAFERGICKGSISFHYVDGAWKLLGIGIELPPDMKITQAQREQRVAACKDPMNPKTCELNRVADGILAQLRDGQAGAVWDAADDVFKTQESRDKFIEIQDQHRAALGAYRRILDVTEAKLTKGSTLLESATFEVLAEFDKAHGVRTVFGFGRNSETAPWKLRSLKIVVPMPRPEDEEEPAGGAADQVPPDPGAGSGSGSGAGSPRAR